MVLITLPLSLIPTDQLPSALQFWDKAQHSLIFFALAFLSLLAYPDRAPTVMFGLALFGAGIEIVQWLTGWHQGDWLDLVADCVGLALGAAAWYLVVIFRSKPG